MSQTDFLSVLAHRFDDFLAFRRVGGVESKNQLSLLRYFDRFLHQQRFVGAWPTREVIEGYLASTQHLQRGTRDNRLTVVRQFCRYLRQFEPQCFVPEKMLPRQRGPSRLAHIYSTDEIQMMLRTARELAPAGSLRPHTYATLIGVLYTTGLRCGEAFALNLENVDLEQQLLFIAKGKFGKARWVPISVSTGEVLEHYLAERSQVAPPGPQSPFFITRTGNRLYHTNAEYAFRQVLQNCGLRGGKGCPGPRLHHLRHTFACTRLLAWYREGKDVNALLPALATYLGHVNVASTQVYLHATTELLEQANQRFRDNFHHNICTPGESQ
ncbi:MAG: tyrosine-type recombinase/integrase [Gammaproteobacteria bacterium]|nr:tyrosine-type recombinase/integrase [Gammaproteobacteria bacterium]